MDIELGQLRSVMHQRVDVTTRWLRERSHFEAAKTRAFDRHHLAELYHENTKYQPATMAVPNRSVRVFDRPGLRYVQSIIGPDYPGVELIDLSPPRMAPTGGLQRAIRTRRSPMGFRGAAVGFDRLAGLLHFASGVTDRVTTGDAAETKPLRAYPSAGALYPVETYVLARRCDGLADGVYYYPTEQAGLRPLRVDPSGFDIAIRTVLVGDDHPAADAPVIIVLTGAFWRAMTKYGSRGYRYVLQESGHLAQNLQLVAGGLDLDVLPVGGFFDDRVNDLIGVDGVDEAAVYLLAVGRGVGGS